MLGSGMEGGEKRQDPSVCICSFPLTIILVSRRFLVLPGNSFGLNGDGGGRRQFPVGLYRVMARDSAEHYKAHESPQQGDLALISAVAPYGNHGTLQHHDVNTHVFFARHGFRSLGRSSCILEAPSLLGPLGGMDPCTGS